jgi:hypothetical protein
VINANAAYGFAGGVFQGTLSLCTLSANTAAVGGGAHESVLSNCTLTGNSTTHGYSDGGGANQSTLFNCLLANNAAEFAGGVKNCTLTDCVLSNNMASSGPGAAWASTLNHCTLVNNAAQNSGGGTYGGVLNFCFLSGNSAVLGGGSDFSTLNDCILTGNSATEGGGAYGGSLNNCILAGNTGYSDGGGADDSSLINCTVVGNYGEYGGGVYGCPVENCIIYYNSAAFDDPNCFIYDPLYDTPNHCCTTVTNGIASITNAPLFVNLGGGDYHLQTSSPCINSGGNAFVSGTNDLDGNPRIRGGTVDIGAYEDQTPASQISYAWLQQYGLPINTNTDTSDPDGDGMNNYQEWVAGTNPTNALSVLAMLTPVPTNTAGLVLNWESVSNRTYFLQGATNLAMQPAFTTIQSNLVGQTGTTSYQDTSATNLGPYFYRVGVQQ